MSTTNTRVPLEEASEIAEHLVALLALSCHRVVIAGSIRREKPDIGDVDLVCEPKVRPLVDMFGDPTGEGVDELHDRLCDLERLGTVEKRRNAIGIPAWGKQLKRATYRGLAVDIRACHDRDSWGFWLLISSGPAAFNKALVTPRYQGGLLPSGFEVKDGFRLYKHGGRVLTPTEESVFEALSIPWIPPSERK